MSAKIHQTTGAFDFSKIHLADPVALQGGSFHSKIAYSTTDEPLYVQTPQCTTKQGVITSGNKMYLDLMFTNINNNFTKWVSGLEERLQQLVYEHRDAWFTEEIELDDIQSNFTPVIKMYKGTNYVVRSYVSTGKNSIKGPSVQIFNENETPRDLSHITSDSKGIYALEIQGVKFTQRSSFHVIILIKQVMIMEKEPLFNTCIITQTPSDDDAPDVNLRLPGADDMPIESGGGSEESAEKTDDGTEPTGGAAEEDIPVTRDDTTTAEKDPGDRGAAEEDVEGLEKLNLVELDTQDLDDETMSLKKPTEVYEEIYREARRKAIEAKKYAINAWAAANKIKKLYSLEDILDSDEDDLSESESSKLEV